MAQRYEVLDGLRGTAAAAIVAVHFGTVFYSTPANPLHHAHLAVDFFYMLSGFVVAHAYDDRWGRMTSGGFFAVRLRRLQPLVVLGVTLGLACYLLDPFASTARTAAPLLVAAAYGLGLLLLPAPALPDRGPQTHPLDGPAWSLTQEYLASFLYGLGLRRLDPRGLTLLTVLSAILLVDVAAREGTLQVGSDWPTVAFAPMRMIFPFLAGLWLQRRGAAIPTPFGWAGLSVALWAIFLAPTLGTLNGLPMDGIFEAAVVILVFPLVIAAGAATPAHGPLKRLCRLSGELSYPVYILHYPLMMVFADWVWTRHPGRLAALGVALALAAFIPVFAWAALKLYDEPLRAWLGKSSRRPSGVSVRPGEAPRAAA